MSKPVIYTITAILPNQERMEVTLHADPLARRGAVQSNLCALASSFVRDVSAALQDQDGVLRQRRRQ